MDHDLRMERRRVRLFFAGLLVISAALDIVGALLVHRQTRSEVLETLLPATVTLGGRAGALLSGVALLLLAVLAPRPAAAERERLHVLINTWGRNHISHLAVHGASSYHWVNGEACVAFTLRGRTALALGDPIGPPEIARRAIPDFLSYCDRQDWIPAFYQV